MSIGKKYVCTNCKSVSNKWIGKCPSCNEWNTLQELEEQSHVPAKNDAFNSPTSIPVNLGDHERIEHDPSKKTGIETLLDSKQGYIVGRIGNEWLQYNTDAHLLTIAPTGEGKGTGLIIPNLYAHEGSIVVVDIRGETVGKTANFRRLQGHKVVVLDPFNVTDKKYGHDSYNPFDRLTQNISGRSADDQIQRLVNALMFDPSGRMSNEPIWDNATKNLLTGLIALCIRYWRPYRHNLVEILDVLNYSPSEMERFIIELKGIIENDPNGKKDRQIKALYKILTESKSTTKITDNALVQAQTILTWAGNKSFEGIIDRSTFSFDDLQKEKMTVYLVVPEEYIDNCAIWVRLMLESAVFSLEDVYSSKGMSTSQLPQKDRVLFLLDELPAFGQLDIISKGMATLRGRGVNLWLFIQNLAQLESTYGKEKMRTIIGNAAAIQVFGSTELEELEYFSRLIGEEFYDVQSVGISESQTDGTSSSSTTSHTISNSESITKTKGTADTYSEATGTNWNKSIGRTKNKSRTLSHNQSVSEGRTSGTNRSTNRGTNRGKNKGTNKGKSYERNLLWSSQKGHNEGESKGTSKGTSKGSSEGSSEGRSKNFQTGSSKGFTTGSSKTTTTSKGGSHTVTKGHTVNESTAESYQKGETKGTSDTQGTSQSFTTGRNISVKQERMKIETVRTLREKLSGRNQLLQIRGFHPFFVPRMKYFAQYLDTKKYMFPDMAAMSEDKIFKKIASRPELTTPFANYLGDFQLTITGGKGEGLFSSQVQTEKGFGNNLVIDDDVVFNNVKAIQKEHHITAAYPPDFKGKNFSIEMETGTGKTYVYLRSAFELNAKYGFKKFIIVVPSVAIREGVLKSIEIMKEDFQALYNNVPFKHFVFDSKRLNKVKSFATGNEFQIMVINIDSFNKKGNNVIYRPNDRMGGFKPVDFIQATNPIVIIDEPQNVESDKAKKALLELNPLCTLRYSATHKDRYNLLYSLDPVKAYQRRLVKKISVASTVADDDPNAAFVKLEKVTNNKGRISCTLAFHKQAKDGAKLAKATFKQDDDLFKKSGKREIYRNNFIVTEINTRPNMEYVKFANNIRLRLGEQNGGARTEIVKEQIRATVEAHFQKQVQVEGRGIKVLSLFFIDKVENYRIHHDTGFELGQYAKWFEEIYNEVSEEYKDFLKADILPVSDVHNGYFSKDKKGVLKNTSGSSQADEDTYSLIMRDKERLLSLDNPLQFIFSHSALREGWDNPNVFQICTLNETKSSLKKRQEIGRGLRLPVNQDGERVKDDDINNLVVVANESYEDFAKNLQKEFEDDCGFVFGRLPFDAFVGIQYVGEDEQEQEITQEQSERIWKHFKDKEYIADDGTILEEFDTAVEQLTFTIPDEIEAPPLAIATTVEQYKLNNLVKKHKTPKKVKLNKSVYLDPEFEKFWKAINTKTIYRVKFDTAELIKEAAAVIKNMDKIVAPRIRTNLADLDINTSGVTAQLVMQGQAHELPPVKVVPDILTYIQNKTELTRSTIFQILKQSGRLSDFPVNPQQFMDKVVKEIRTIMNHLIIKGIVYEKLEGIQYEMTRFQEDEGKLFFPEERIIPTDKSVYDYILWDSGVEKQFAKDLEANLKVKYYIKLPSWFTIDTPVGTYNPDWAILKQNGDVVYMIRETKSTKEQMKLRITETDKIRCGKAHFESIGVDYDVATNIGDLAE